MGDILAFDQKGRSSRSRSAAAKRGRSAVALWFKEIKAQRVAKKLKPIDEVVARGLTDFPSAVYEGLIWPSQSTLAERIAVSLRTLNRSLARLKACGCLSISQRGNGRSARCVLCIEGIPIVPPSASATPQVAKQATPEMARLTPSATPQVAKESCDSLESIEFESPPKPPTNGEVFGPQGEPTFDEFWKVLTDNPGPSGPAIAQWRKLSRDDKLAIGRLMGPQGLGLDGMWATTWLADRRFERQRLHPQGGSRITVAVDRLIAQLENLEPYSPEWNDERSRKLAAGQSIALMDSWALEGRSWTRRES